MCLQSPIATATHLFTGIHSSNLVSFFAKSRPTNRTMYLNVHLDILKFSFHHSSTKFSFNRVSNQNWFLGHNHARLTRLVLRRAICSRINHFRLGIMSLLADNNLYQMMMEIDWLPQLYEAFLVSNERTVLSLPLRNFCRSIFFNLLSHTCEFYCALLHNGIILHKYSLCLEYHCLNYLCLPDIFVPAREKLPNILGSKEGILQYLSSESHKRSYLDTVVLYIQSLEDITRYGNSALLTTPLQHRKAPSLRCSILSPHSNERSTADTILLSRHVNVRSMVRGQLQTLPLPTN